MRVRRWFEGFLLLAGVLAIDVWIWSHAAGVLYDAWQERAFDREIQESETQQRGTPEPGTQEAETLPPTQPGEARPRSLESPAIHGPLGRLSIPRLHLRAIVQEGVGEDTLSLALGHIPSTALPGQAGNVGVAGHRDTIFRGLRDIRKNDLIVFETRTGRYAYRVTGTQIVRPNQVSVLKASTGRELTLVTCYPFHYIGSAPERFIVKARQAVVPKERSRKPWRAA